ncbi:hypothetical protein EGCR1_08980 [Enterococcus gilvus]|jgi:uncharacterized phage protein (TIGR01671 family)|uniref:YopX family protein n=1 Tax=Enterococcus gilvus TaxID=160453 RepID=UPI000DF5E712|nr:YopX family protein [Enterococcus gilvus]AXG38833.1 hypothetical protein EGCR1_08980 [Enterococcus gilvus]
MIPKFREWDPERQRIHGKGMSYSVREEFDDSVNFRFDHEEDLDYTTRLSETDRNGTPYRNLMMSTGLKDKNGVEIFEGDVVVGQQHLTTDSSTPFEIKGLVRYSKRNTMFYLDEKSFGHDKFMNSLGSSIYQFVVIGNIYENPELLEVEG